MKEVGANAVLGPVLITNAGVLVVLLFGPNSAHQILPLAYGGAAVAVIGMLAIVRAILERRRGVSTGTDRR